MDFIKWDLDEVDKSYEGRENHVENDETPEEIEDLSEIDLCDESVDGFDECGTLSDNLENLDLFEEFEAGDYRYRDETHGKIAWGSLELSDEGKRNLYAQRTVGGEFREDTDDGGHLIGTRFAGSGEKENLDAQNQDVNRGAYKAEENRWASELKSGNKVFVDVETYKREGVDRPDAYMGYSIVEDENGNRTWDAFSFQNVSREEQAEWAESDEGEWVDDE